MRCKKNHSHRLWIISVLWSVKIITLRCQKHIPKTLYYTVSQILAPPPQQGNNRKLKSGMETKHCFGWTLKIKGYNVNIAGSSQITRETQAQPTHHITRDKKDHTQSCFFIMWNNVCCLCTNRKFETMTHITEPDISDQQSMIETEHTVYAKGCQTN